jgi:glycosyltransferase involved in cell wall biosynthesis
VLEGYQRYLNLGGDPDIKLVIAGQLSTRDSEFTPDPRRLARDLNLQAQVHCCGWVSETDKLTLYALATAYVFPSFYEGFGMTVLEAMAAGTAVVTSAG